MIWHQRWCKRGQSDFDRLDSVVREQVLAVVNRFARTGVGDIIKLRARPNEWRLRAGDWRVILRLDYRERTMAVIRVQHRRESYR